MARYWANINEANMVEKVERVEGFEGKTDSECIDFVKALNKNTDNWIECYKQFDGNPRGSFPAVGHVYLTTENVFVPQKPYPSWTLSDDQTTWKPPVARPAYPSWTPDAEITAEELAAAEKIWAWDEDSQSWV